ncbi:peptidase [Rhizobium deserti]|uniref:Peptidase n=1 Tax=Rhizobium deserti TaxID=2547961 RepID=A0A4V3APB5_9HYPH|nr:prepilin peptidase [Rhizobium deserti]TDK35478.1 peptidase [Rhizobium deserti]
MVLTVCMIVPFCLALAAVSDLLTMTIPNKLSLAMVALFLILAPFSGLAWSAIGLSVLAASAVFAVCFALFAFNIMGGGDAKLLTATALWFGFDHSLVVFLITVAYAGGGVTLLFLLMRSQAHTVMAMGVPLPASMATAKKVPYGIAIAIGGFFTFDQAPIVQWAMHALG